MRRYFLLLISPLLIAQQPVAPTPEEAGSPRGTNTGDYNVTDSFETGYRFALIDGNLGKYRSDVNYGNGIRLLGSSLAVHSRDGHGRWFDEILLNTQGLGNDPYQSAILRAEKNGLYRYDMTWRMDEFYNPGLTVAFGEHLYDTRRRLQDHDLLLLPRSAVKLRLGYTRNTQTGPALSTVQLFDSRGGIFPLFTDVRRAQNEYRLGADIDYAGFKITLLHRWDYYKEDTPYTLDGITSNAGTTLNSFNRAQPYHGRSPGWFGNLTTNRKWWAINGRIVYNSGLRNFILDESAAGASRFGAQNRQVLVGGDARRPVTAGDFSFSIFPGERLTIVNNTSVHSTRIDGNAAYLQYDNATQTANGVYFNYLGIRAISNATDVNYRAGTWLNFYGGYHFSTRRIRTIEDFNFSPFVQNAAYEQENNLHAGVAGVRIAPAKPLSINVDGEYGRADGPFTPLSERNYHAMNARVQYRTRRLTLATAYRQNYNNNSVAVSIHSAKARNYSASASWNARDWFGLDAGYTKLHLDTISGLVYFEAVPAPTPVGGNSIYISNIHAATLTARFTVRKRVDFFAGYNITKDTGDGRSTPLSGVGDPVLLPVQTFPLTYHSPLARVSVRIGPKLRWNAGWQFYRYREQFGLFSVYQNYRANTGYTSVSFSF